MVVVPVKKVESKFLKPIKSIGDLMNGRNYILYNGQLIYKNGKGYVMTDISEDQEYTVDDYLKLPESAPFQLINGKLTYMPSPKFIHQQISGVLFVLLFLHNKKLKLGTVSQAPLDVHFDEKNVFQPDLLFISNERKDILKDWVYGAPDLVVEIISKGTESVDRQEKMKVYGQYNVLEYWLVSPGNQQVEVFENQGGQMVLRKVFGEKDTLTSRVLQGFEMPVEQLFQ